MIDRGLYCLKDKRFLKVINLGGLKIKTEYLSENAEVEIVLHKLLKVKLKK